MNSTIRKITWVTVFSIAMGYMESVVVVYLRKIYYPNGFQFPLIPMDTELAFAEIFREAATIIMLVGIGYLTGKKTSQKFAYFIFSFAVWDIFYYIFLKLLLNWPESLLTWDILFLIPVPWTGPVIAPCLVSLSMILLTSVIIYFHDKGCNTKIKLTEWLLLSAGSLIVILSFTWDFMKYISGVDSKGEVYKMSGDSLEIINYIPVDFNWELFAAGLFIILSGITIFIRRMKLQQPVT